ncbi:MAG: glycoside hydrolase family 16 protein [Gammaproteobacteria bacterium]|nr:glycoside hydrolase family 16 protein [Gammaproteobacteria bacterium]
MPGAEWSGNVALGIVDPDDARNRLVRLTASTDRTKTRQAQFCHQRKYYEGTYAARVRWADAPMSGPDGDQIVETFYMIAPLKAPLDTDYSELDFEYLANGGWGSSGETLFVTTWETFNPEPLWLQINKNSSVSGSRAGWHTLVATVADGTVTYFIDGERLGEHGGPYYPEEPMSINFNLWFIRDGLHGSTEPRTWQQDVDWVFHEARRVLTPAQVVDKVEALRRAGIAFRDTVPARDPPLDSPCDF